MGLAASTSAVLKNLGALMGVIVLVAALGWGSEAPVTLKSAACFGAACFARAFWLAAILAILNFLVNLLPRKRGRGGGGAGGPAGEGAST